MSGAMKVVLAIVGLGLVATVVVNGPNTAAVVNSVTGGFAQDIGDAANGKGKGPTTPRAAV